jgi:hypothetical protein
MCLCILKHVFCIAAIKSWRLDNSRRARVPCRHACYITLTVGCNFEFFFVEICQAFDIKLFQNVFQGAKA